MTPTPLWVPSEQRQAESRLRRYLDRHGFEGYDEAWRWSVAPQSAGDFWSSIVDEFGVSWSEAPDNAPENAIVADRSSVTGARWFPGGRLNYAERALHPPGADPDAIAIMAVSQTRPPTSLDWTELRHLVGRVRHGLLAAGVQRGDRVAGYLPNIPETLAAMLATASIGATWTCCAPEMGTAGVLDRLTQVEPKVLIAVDGYRYGERAVDRTSEAQSIRSGLTGLVRSIWLSYLDTDRDQPSGWISWDDFLANGDPLRFEPVDFAHPLYILFSSGTTGKPKPIVHGHGGITIEHVKALGLHFDLGAGDRFFWFTTTGWMMWNFCVSGLLVGSTVVLFDGDPGWPGPDSLWDVMATSGTTCGGVGAAYLVANMKADLVPGAGHSLGSLRTLGVTGSPLPATAAKWVYGAVAPELMLSSFSGGTDVCTGFVGSSPLHPVWPGEISCRCLGASAEVFDGSGRPVVGEEGELVLTAPMPSMPVGFWGDPGGLRFRATYYDRYPGVWAHGDRATLTDRGSVVITGRSDGTLNRGGVRMGTAEFYSVVEGLDGVADSLVVHLEDNEGGPGELWLLVVPAGASVPADGPDRPDLEAEIRSVLRRDLSPRYAPDRIVMVSSIPRTQSGKKLEVPVRKILSGAEPADVLTMASMANPESIEPIVVLARDRRADWTAS